jgi:hypothetical protein
MIEDTSKNSDFAELRKLSLDEIDMTSGAGLVSWLKSIFGGDDPKPARGPFNQPTDPKAH